MPAKGLGQTPYTSTFSSATVMCCHMIAVRECGFIPNTTHIIIWEWGWHSSEEWATPNIWCSSNETHLTACNVGLWMKTGRILSQLTGLQLTLGVYHDTFTHDIWQEGHLPKFDYYNWWTTYKWPSTRSLVWHVYYFLSIVYYNSCQPLAVISMNKYISLSWRVQNCY
jgi:hypothetical protein